MNHRVSRVSSIRRLCGALFVGAIWQFGACGDSDDPPTTSVTNPTRGEAGTMKPDPGGGGGTEGDTQTSPSSQDSGVTPPEVTPDAGPVTFCTPGETQPCQFELLCSGLSTCSPDGSAFGVCDCGALNSDVARLVGARCESDGDCAGGAFCLSASSNDYNQDQGGPAGGYCTFTCSDDTGCTERDPSSFCTPLGPGGSSICMRTCLSRQAEPGEAKCLNRPELACISLAADGQGPIDVERQLGVCAPRCGSDEDCPDGRLCHRQGGICTDFPPPGAPAGSACSADPDCDGGACEDRVNRVGICTALCVLGSLSGCGYGNDPISRDAACVTPVVAAGRFSEGPGDLGFCLRLCDNDADCQGVNQILVCNGLSEELASFFGRSGACVRGQ